nr:unnamed protein product [Spirometra erinaceieuropaei]
MSNLLTTAVSIAFVGNVVLPPEAVRMLEELETESQGTKRSVTIFEKNKIMTDDLNERQYSEDDDDDGGGGGGGVGGGGGGGGVGGGGGGDGGGGGGGGGGGRCRRRRRCRPITGTGNVLA